jgi:altronate dehydratase small subunit
MNITENEKWDAVVLNPLDQVATALNNLSAGQSVRVRSGEVIETIVLADDIPLCHKFSVRAVAQGGVIHKYGEAIGAASTDIEVGRHVHIHNLKSLRAQRN